METKICSKCKEEKELCFFGVDKKRKDGFRVHCNDCRKIESLEYRKRNPKKRKETIKKYYENNKEKIKEIQSKLDESVKNQDYESAIKYRDELKKLKS